MKKSKKQTTEKDSVYFLKLVLFFVLGTLWVHLGSDNGLPVPVGLLFGIILAGHEHFAVDRKIEYAMLLVACVLSFIMPIGFVLTV